MINSNAPKTPAPELTARHALTEDVQGLFVGSLFVGLALMLFKASGVLTGGTAGLAFLVHYTAGWPLGAVLFVINLPFYVFAWRALGLGFMIKTFIAVGLLSAYVELLPRVIGFSFLDPVFAAIMGGLLSGVGILILIRHGSSLGGLNVMAVFLQKRFGWRAGTVQMIVDVLILLLALLIVSPQKVLLSILAAGALNLVIAVNHRADRYFGA